MSNPVSRFWWRWLVAVTCGVLAFGLSLVLLPDVMQRFFNTLIFSSSDAPTTFSDEATRYVTFVCGVLGAVMVGWAVALLYILRVPFRREARSAWYAITLSIGIWFVIDSAFTIYTGYVGNLILNIPFFVLFIIPLFATFNRPKSS